MERLRVLFAAACPPAWETLAIGRELTKMANALHDGRAGGRFETRPLLDATQEELVRVVIRFKPHILHFSGHGTEQEALVIDDGNGGARSYDATDLSNLLTAYEAAVRPKLVVLNACYSAAQAQHITAHVECAVGIARLIEDTHAVTFTNAFYEGLADGASVEQAVKRGHASIPSTAVGLPALHVRADVDPATLVLAGAGPLSHIPDDFHIDRAPQIECFTKMLATGQPALLVLTAGANMGKSHLTQVLARKAEEHVVLRVELDKGAVTPHVVLDQLEMRLRRALGDDVLAASPPRLLPGDNQSRSQPVALEPEHIAEEHGGLLRRTAAVLDLARTYANQSGRRVVLIVDGFDQTTGDLADWLQRHLIPEVLLREELVAVIAGREVPMIVSDHHRTRVERLGNFDIADVHAAMRQLGIPPSDEVARWAWHFSNDGFPYSVDAGLRKGWAALRAQR